MSRQKLLMLAGGGLVTLLVFGGVFTRIASDRGLNSSEKLGFALTLLDDDRWDLAGRLARDMEHAGAVDPSQSAVWHYVTGVSKVQSVLEDLDTPSHRQTLLEAIEHLREADELGFPIGYQGQGDYYLGLCLFQTHLWNEAIDKLDDVPLLWPARRSEAYRMIVDAHLRQQPPNLVAARAILTRWQAIPGMSSRERARAQLVAARLAFSDKDLDTCERLLVGLDPSLPEYSEALLWRGRWRIEATARGDRSTARHPQWNSEAAAILRKVIRGTATPDTLRRQASYLVGINLRQQGKLKEALGALSGVRQRSPYATEAIAAGLEEAEILLEFGQLEGVLTTVHHILRSIGDLKLYSGSWISVDELRLRLFEIGRALQNQQEYERVIQLAEYLALVFPLNDTVRLQAETYQQWADELAASPLGTTNEAKATRRQLLNERYRSAAGKFEQLAQLELRSPNYPRILWQATEAYRKANDLRKANEFLIDYLRFEDRVKRPRGFVALGRNYIHAGEWEKSIEPLERCLTEYPTNPVSYEARLLAARAKSELGALDEAIDLLESNLGDFHLDPGSPLWQDSLFELGQTIFQRGDQLLLDASAGPFDADKGEQLVRSHEDFLQGIQRLSEAVSRYPTDPRYYDTRFLLAKSYRLAARMPEQLIKSNSSMVESARRDLSKQRRQLLETALESFRQLHQEINSRQDASANFEQTLAIVRNSYFGEADSLFDLERWEEAIGAYHNAASRFLNQPESLEALVQLALCHRKMGREFEAKKALAQAEQVLSRVPAEYDSRFVSFTRASRQEWVELIGWLRKWD